MKPILFSTLMVKAIMDGQKTQTRRVIKFPKGRTPHWYHGPNEEGLHDFMFGAIDPENRMAIDWSEFVIAPFAVGDELWVRETWRFVPRSLRWAPRARAGWRREARARREAREATRAVGATA